LIHEGVSKYPLKKKCRIMKKDEKDIDKKTKRGTTDVTQICAARLHGEKHHLRH